MLEKIFWAKRKEVRRGWRKFLNELHNFRRAHQVLFGSLNQGNEMGGAWGRHGGKKKFIKGFGGES